MIKQKLTKVEIELLNAYRTIWEDYERKNPESAKKMMEYIRKEYENKYNNRDKDGK